MDNKTNPTQTTFFIDLKALANETHVIPQLFL
jgi:hypothetical protein